MKMNIKITLIIACFMASFATYGLAEDTSPTGQTVQEKIAQLKALREENPEAFREELKKHREEVRGRLQKLRDENPEKFKEIAERRRGRFRERLEHLRQENPEHFKQLTEKHRERLEQRAEYFKTHDPEKYGRFMQKRIEKLADLKERNPERFNHFLENHPHFRERVETASPEMRQQIFNRSENVRDKRENLRNRSNKDGSQSHRLRRVIHGGLRRGRR